MPAPVNRDESAIGIRSLQKFSSLAATAVLATAAAAHVGWAFGRSWPAGDRDAAASMFAGADEVPGPAACLAVAGLLGTAAALAAGVGGGHPVARLGRAGVAGTLFLRGVAGLTGNTDRLVGWKLADDFKETDRRIYGPGCLVVGTLVGAGRS